MSECVYIDIKNPIKESAWNDKSNQEKLKYLEDLIGYEIHNGDNLTYYWDGCPVSDFGGALDSSGDPYIVVQPTCQYIKFKKSGSSQTYKEVYSEQVNGKTIVSLLGTSYWGEISFAIDTNSLYRWKNEENGANEVDELNAGLGFILDDNVETKKISSTSSDDVYLINTQNFKIQDKKICVYGKTGASQVDSGNYTYDYNFNYGYASGKNYYAWGKNEVQAIPIYTNESTGGIPTIAWNGKVLSVNNQNYVLPNNSKIVVYKRQGGVMSRKAHLEIKNQEETIATTGNYDQWTPYAQYYINLTWVSYDVETAIHTDSTVTWAKSTNNVPDKDFPERPKICEYWLEFTNQYSYCEITKQCDSVSAQELQYTSESVPTQYSQFFTLKQHTKEFNVDTGDDEIQQDHSCQSYLTGKTNREEERSQSAGGGQIVYYYRRGTAGYVSMSTLNLYYCNLFKSPLQNNNVSIWNHSNTKTYATVARKYNTNQWKSYTGIRMNYTLDGGISGLMSSNTYSSNTNSFSWFNGYDTFHNTNFKSDFPITYNFLRTETYDGDKASAYMLACSTISGSDINRNATYWIFVVPNN